MYDSITICLVKEKKNCCRYGKRELRNKSSPASVNEVIKSNTMTSFKMCAMCITLLLLHNMLYIQALNEKMKLIILKPNPLQNWAVTVALHREQKVSQMS